MSSHRSLTALVTVGIVCALAATTTGVSHAQITFTDIGAGFPGMYRCSAAWGDYDNDGDLDILLTGSDSTLATTSRVYRNDSGVFTDIAAGLPGIRDGSVAWGDYDNDGDLDILLSGCELDSARVYRNDGGAFTDIDAGLPDVEYSSSAWGDYDNDGDLDILLVGESYPDPISRVYRNDGEGMFADSGTWLPLVHYGSVAWGDYDNDGDLDILMSGTPGDSSHICRNDDTVFSDIQAGLPPLFDASVAWGDYDNDGDLDVLLAGAGSTYNPISRVYRNDAGVFTDIDAGLPGVYCSSVAWGDCDNDGDLDILLAGDTTSTTSPGSPISRIYRNDGGGVFSDLEAGLSGVYRGSVAWGDYDNDGDLDILLAGRESFSPRVYISRVYRNDGVPANTTPGVPGGLTASLWRYEVTLSWTASTDAQTPSSGLSYNLRVGTTPGGSEVMPAMADASTGYRRVVQLGNAQKRTSWTLTLPVGEYYWSVQALDGAYGGSPFAEEQTVQVSSVEGEEDRLPTIFFLGPPIPNPFNPVTEIRYGIPASGGASRVTMNVYNALGRRLTTLVDEEQGPGEYRVVWDGRDHKGAEVASGVYFYRITWNGKSETRRMVLLK